MPGGGGRDGSRGAVGPVRWPGRSRVGGSSGRLQMEKPDEGLPKIAAATGGGYFELTSAGSLADVRACRRRASSPVSLGFTPEKLNDQDARPHRPPVAARADGARAQALLRLEVVGRYIGRRQSRVNGRKKAVPGSDSKEPGPGTSESRRYQLTLKPIRKMRPSRKRAGARKLV